MNGERLKANATIDPTRVPCIRNLGSEYLSIKHGIAYTAKLVAASARPIAIPKVMKLKTLADVRELLGRLPAQVHRKDTWQHVEAQLAKAANGGDLSDMLVALRLVFSIEGIECDV